MPLIRFGHTRTQAHTRTHTPVNNTDVISVNKDVPREAERSVPFE